MTDCVQSIDEQDVEGLMKPSKYNLNGVYFIKNLATGEFEYRHDVGTSKEGCMIATEDQLFALNATPIYEERLEAPPSIDGCLCISNDAQRFDKWAAEVTKRINALEKGE